MLINNRLRKAFERSAVKLGIDVALLIDWARTLNPEDEVDSGITEELCNGNLEVDAIQDGEPSFRITKLGQERVEHLLKESAEARSFLARLKGH